MRTTRALVVAAMALGLAGPLAGGVEAGAPPAETDGAGAEAVSRYIVTVADQATLDAKVGESRAAGNAPVHVYRDVLTGYAIDLTAAAAAELASEPGVVDVEPDGVVSISADQNNPPSWGLDRVDQRNLPLNNKYTYNGDGMGVTMYIIDTGLNKTHVDFAGRVSPSFFDPIGPPGNNANDCNGHGTHVAGTAGGTSYGVAKKVTIVPVRVLDCAGNGFNSDVIAGMNFVAAQHSAGQPAVANMSLGGGASSSVDAAVNNLIADGVTVVVAAGNSADNSCFYSPARVPNAITVAASTIVDDDASFSNFGPCNDLFAPGVNITSAWIGSNTATNTINGTSMASPHVAGGAALFLQGNPGATPAQVWAAIDAASTKGVLSECCGDPDKLLYTKDFGGAPPPPPDKHLTVQKTGVGDGVVLSDPGPIHCGATCEADYAHGTSVKLRAIAQGYSYLDSWLGDCSGISAWCTLAMTVNRTATAWFKNAIVTNGVVTQKPIRVYDSRLGGFTATALAPGSTTAIPVAGVAGVPANAAAVFMNVTVDGAVGDGFLTAYPCGEALPVASNINYKAGRTIANTVVAKPGTNGEVCFYTWDAIDLIVDIGGFANVGSGVVTMTPKRNADTRGGPKPGPGSIIKVKVAGTPEVPANAKAVIMNVGAVDPAGWGYITAYPCGGPTPNASNINYLDTTIANTVIAKPGTNGEVCFYTYNSTHLIVDVGGYASSTSGMTTFLPKRVKDTRGGAKPAPNSVTVVKVAGPGSIAGVPANARAVIMNVAAVDPATGGYVTAFPCGEGLPTASNLNYIAGQTIANTVIAKPGVDGTVCFYTNQSTHLLVDISGYAVP